MADPQQNWMQQLQEMAARRAGQGTEYKQPAPGAESGAPPFTWELKVKGQGSEFMPSIPGQGASPAPGPAPGMAGGAPPPMTPERQQKRQRAKGLLLAAQKAGVQMPFGQSGRQADPNAQYAALGDMAIQPQAQGGARDATLGNLLNQVNQNMGS